jgi:hypothetical protein
MSSLKLDKEEEHSNISRADIEAHKDYIKLCNLAKDGIEKLVAAAHHVDFLWLKVTFYLYLFLCRINSRLKMTLSMCINTHICIYICDQKTCQLITNAEEVHNISATFASESHNYFERPSPPSVDVDQLPIGGAHSSGPITDIVVLFKGDKVPDGYKMIEKTRGGRAADVNYKNNGKSVFLAVSRSAPLPCITGLAIILADKGEHPPPEFEVIKKTVGGQLADLNAGSGGHQIFLCVRRGFGTPITDVEVFFPNHTESLSPGFVKLNKTVFSFPADLNSGGNGEM